MFPLRENGTDLIPVQSISAGANYHFLAMVKWPDYRDQFLIDCTVDDLSDEHVARKLTARPIRVMSTKIRVNLVPVRGNRRPGRCYPSLEMPRDCCGWCYFRTPRWTFTAEEVEIRRQ